MSVEIKVASIEPIRQTFARTARRFGADKPASRYQEASFDLQPRDNFHYRPVWDPEREIYDARRTALVMEDWDAFKDPRQFYYATYVINRARLQESAEKNFEFVEKHGLMATLPDALRTQIETTLLPFRHMEWAANLNNCFISAYCSGSSIAQAAIYSSTDRLAMAQYLSRIGLLLDGNSGQSLAGAKERWLHDDAWQPLRRLMEHSMVQKDWFEIFVAQNLVIDALVHPVFHARLHSRAGDPGTAFLAMLTEFMEAWYADNGKWVDACLKTAAAESAGNRARLQGWIGQWLPQVVEAVTPLANLLGEDGPQRLDDAVQALHTRTRKLGLEAA